MIPLSSSTSSGFTWSKLRRNGGYEVKLNGIVAGKLRRRSLWSSNYEATTLEGTFTFRSKGWCGTKAEVVDFASQRQIALFESAWRRRSTLTFADGQKFYFERKGCWRPQWGVFNENGQPVLSLQMREKTGEAPVGSKIEANRLLVLIMFILYRIRQAEEEAAAATTVAGIVGAS